MKLVRLCLALACGAALAQTGQLPPMPIREAPPPLPVKPVVPAPAGLTADEARNWHNLYAAPWVKTVQVIGFVDPKVLDTKRVTITVDGKAFELEGDYIANWRSKGSWAWEGRGPEARATFYGDIAREKPVSGQIVLAPGRHFQVSGRLLVEYTPGQRRDDTPGAPKRPASGVQK